MRRNKDPLRGKRDNVSQLYRAVRRYVEDHGGMVAVIGGIQIEQGVMDRAMNWQLCVRVTGRMPKLEKVSP